MAAEDVEDVEDLDQADALEEASEEISKDEGRRSLKLWFAVLGSPVAWAGHLGVNYSLEEWFACSRSNEHPGKILGIHSNTLSLLTNGVMLAVAVASGLVALRCWRQLKGKNAAEGGDRARWMAFAGTVEGALFVGIILLGFLPGLVLQACEGSP